MGLTLPINAHGRRFKKADVSVVTDISAARAIPTDNEWPVILLTPADRGEPGLRKDVNGKPVPFNNESQAKEYFGAGDPFELCRQTFNPSPRGEDIVGPAEVFGLRVGSPTQAILPLENPALTDALTLTSRDFGTLVNSIEVKVDKTGDRHTLTFRDGTLVFSTPVLGPQFVLIYHGAGTAATLTITRTGGVAVTLSTTITGAASDNLSVSIADFATMNDLVNNLNAKDSYTARMLDEGLGDLPPTGLDAESAEDLLSPIISEDAVAINVSSIEFTTDIEALGTVEIGDRVSEPDLNAGLGRLEIVDIQGKFVFVNETLTAGAVSAGAPFQEIFTGVETTAILPAIAKNLNDENSLVTAAVVEAGNDGTGLDVIPFTRLDAGTAGTNPAVVTQDWLDAQDEIEQKFKGQGVMLLMNTTDRILHSSFVDFSEEKYTKDEGIFPIYSGANRDEVKATSLARGPFLNSRFAHIVGHGGTVLDETGNSKDVDGVFGAAMLVGQIAGSGLVLPSTFNRATFIRLDRDNTDDDLNDFITNGVVALEEDPSKGFVFQIVVTTAQSGNRLESIAFLNHQRNTLERALRREIKNAFLGKALTRLVQGGIRDTARLVAEGFLDNGDGTGFLQSVGSITVESDTSGLVKVELEVDHIDELDNLNAVIHSKIATFVDVSVSAAA